MGLKRITVDHPKTSGSMKVSDIEKGLKEERARSVSEKSPRISKGRFPHITPKRPKLRR